MFERYLSFADYVRDYGLERSEGLLLRHLMQVWKVLAQTVPDTAKTDAVVEMEDYFRELIRGIDSSLLDEWERLQHPDFVAADTPAKPARPASFDLTRDAAAWQRLVRTGVLGFLQDVASRDWEAARARLGTASDFATEAGQLAEARRIEREFAAYFEARGRFRLDPEGRAAKHTHIDRAEDASGERNAVWVIGQVLVDRDGENDWEATMTVSLPDSRAENRVVLNFVGVKPVGA
jgi:hypothetical protein